VVPTLIAVTFPAPSFNVSLSLNRLDIIVPAEIMEDKIPAYESGTPNAAYISGHAAPNIESGNPRLINAKYIITKII